MTATSATTIDGSDKTAEKLSSLISLFGEINDLKRLHVAGQRGSMAERFFRGAWGALLLTSTREEVARVAFRVTARAVAAARLGGINEQVLRRAGLSTKEIDETLRSGFDEVAAPLDSNLREHLNAALGEELDFESPGPPFVELLAEQPRAGATRPDRPRLMLVPTESHADHCLTVAVYATALAPLYRADPSIPFLASMAHHLHNALMPDAGFTGEELLGAHLGRVIENLRREVLSELPERLRSAAIDAIEITAHAETPEAKTFHAADVIDRVLQMKWHAQAASFTLGMALDEMELVHAGPIQSFHHEVLRGARLI